MKRRLNPHVSVDCVVFGFDSSRLKVLLVERDYTNPGSKIQLHDRKLPGSLVYEEEELDHAANRVLKELTGLKEIYLEQFKVFDAPDRTKNPTDRIWLEGLTGISIGRIITVAYYSLIPFGRPDHHELKIKKQASWVDMDEIGNLAFDHNDIIRRGLDILRSKVQSEPIALELLPKKFTLRQVQDLYEAILGISLDNRNFRKKIHRVGYFIPLQEKQSKVSHKPARYYRFDKKLYEKARQDAIIFSI
jgi:8-oxo-dGTP diphosphatase